MDCKSMSTLMTMNLKKLSDVVVDSDLVDPTVYQQLVGSLMYLVNTRLDICFAVSTLGETQFHQETINSSIPGLRFLLQDV